MLIKFSFDLFIVFKSRRYFNVFFIIFFYSMRRILFDDICNSIFERLIFNVFFNSGCVDVSVYLLRLFIIIIIIILLSGIVIFY